MYITTIDDMDLKYDRTDGPIVKGVRKQILHSFSLDKPPRFKFFSYPESLDHKKINKIVLNNKKSYLEVDDKCELVLW